VSPGLRAVSLWLRLVEKPWLARARDIPAARARLDRKAARLFRPPRDVELGSERLADGLRLVRARPPGATGRAILYLHGGAFLMGSPETHLSLAARLARAAGAEAWLPDYRLAPEHPHPAALDDARAAYAALLGRGVAPERVAVAGDSAGGGLAFALVNAARAAGLPDPACLVGFSPWVDMTMRAPSLARNARADCMLPVARMAEVVAWRMGGGALDDPAASPALAVFDRPPPPALIQASRTEILADDAEAMARALRRAGGEATLEWFPRAPHACQLFAAIAPEARAAVARAGGFIAAHAP
jgi:acetyl esterase/lipase